MRKIGQMAAVAIAIMSPAIAKAQLGWHSSQSPRTQGVYSSNDKQCVERRGTNGGTYTFCGKPNQNQNQNGVWNGSVYNGSDRGRIDRQREIEREREIARQRDYEIARQREIERQREYEIARARDIQRERVIRAREIERQRQLEQARLIERQRQYERERWMQAGRDDHHDNGRRHDDHHDNGRRGWKYNGNSHGRH